MLLEVKDLWIHYRVAEAVRSVSIAVEAGEIVGIVGANGAGKTTVLRTISGLKKATSGEIWFEGQRIDGLPPDRIVELGIGHSPEGRRLFHSMKVIDNLMLGAYLRKDKAEIRRDLDSVYEHFPILKMRASQLAASLSGGEQQMLALARALMSKPKLLLLDEPSLGLSPLLMAEVARIIENINKTGVSVVLVEQNTRIAFKLSDRVYVLEVGKVILEGKTSEIVQDERVKKAYLGG